MEVGDSRKQVLLMKTFYRLDKCPAGVSYFGNRLVWLATHSHLDVFQHPSIGEAAGVFERLSLVSSLSVIDARHHCGVLVQDHLHILNVQQAGLEFADRRCRQETFPVR